jgi:hypothetical protein
VKSVVVLVRDIRIAERDRELSEAPTPVAAIEWADSDKPRVVSAELLPALSGPMKIEELCICSHDLKSHNGGGACEIDRCRCNLYGTREENDEFCSAVTAGVTI